jgi:imidazolonepropionase
MTVLVTNIKLLAGVREKTHLLRGEELANLPSLENAFLLIKDGLIAEYGTMNEIGKRERDIHNKIDATDQFVLPTWCDSHTHLVFAASREEEFADKIKGLNYADIAARGGGILNSAKKLADKTELELLRLAWNRLQELIQHGTGAVEIKSD